jgi:hypothetical protein
LVFPPDLRAVESPSPKLPLLDDGIQRRAMQIGLLEATHIQGRLASGVDLALNGGVPYSQFHGRAPDQGRQRTAEMDFKDIQTVTGRGSRLPLHG